LSIGIGYALLVLLLYILFQFGNNAKSPGLLQSFISGTSHLFKSAPNDKIVIIGKTDRPGSATLAAAAMLNSFAEIESDSLKSDIDIYQFELSHMATQLWPKFEEEMINYAGINLPDKCRNCEILTGGCFSRGTYVINNASADGLDDDNYDAIISALKMLDEPFEYVDPKDIPNYFPKKRYRALRAIYIPKEGWLNPRIVIEKLDSIMRNSPQVELINGDIHKLFKTQDKISHLKLTQGKKISGDNYILCTGSTVSEILKKSNLGINVQPVFHGVGVSIEIKSPEFKHTNCIRTPNRGFACGIYSAPYFTDPESNNDHILIGSTNYIASEIPEFPHLENVEFLLRAAREQINVNFSSASIVRINLGMRPTTQDTYPLFGKTEIDNLILATGTKRDGFHMSPIISNKISSILFDEKIEEEFSYFSPNRELIRSLTREEAIEKVVRHRINGEYQHEYNPSDSGKTEGYLERFYRDESEKLHDKVGAFDWGIPPDMEKIYRDNLV